MKPVHRCEFVVIVLLSTYPTLADDWPQFRGPTGDGRADAVEVPLVWGEAENVAWKTPLAGRGWSSPVVLGDQVWLTTALESPQAEADEIKRRIEQMGMSVPSPYLASAVTLKALCVDRASGRLLHEVTLFEVDQPPVLCNVNSYASPTPVAEPGRLYCDFGSMGTVCLDTTTRKTLWSRRLPIEHQVGPGSSPLVFRDWLILVRDGCDRQYITALDKNTGRTVWKTDRPPIASSYLPFRKAFSTPTIVAVGDVEQMVIPGAQWMAAYDPVDGSEQWRVDTGGTFSNSMRPVCGHGMAYVGTAYGGSKLLAIRLDGQGDVTQTHVAWESKKQVPKKSSPLLVGDELYFVSDLGVVNCVDARTGETHYSARLPDALSASPVYADGRIYIFGEAGTTTVLRPGKQLVKLAENELDGHVMASPAVVDGAIFLRNDTHLYRIGER